MRVLYLAGDSTLADRCGRWLQAQPGLELSSIEDRPEFGVSVGWKHKVPTQTLARCPIVNLHTGYLPWNRGMYPNVWPLVDWSPAGVTLHWMDEGIDTGDIIAQWRVDVVPWDTAATLWNRLADAAYDLFTATMPEVFAGTAPRTPQTGPGMTHRKVELETLTLRLDERQTVRETLAVLRARSYPGYPGVRFTENGETWEVTVNCRRVES